MKLRSTAIDGVFVIEPQVFEDSRGFFLETYHQERYAEAGIPDIFVQDNHSRSTAGTLRGLHAQLRKPQGKLVRAVEGEIFDVAVDIRPHSATFGQWVGERLAADDFRQLWIPAGFAHGFCVLTELAQVEYKCTDLYDAEDEIAIAWDDPEIGIVWPIEDPILSDKDKRAPSLRGAIGATLLDGS